MHRARGATALHPAGPVSPPAAVSSPAAPSSDSALDSPLVEVAVPVGVDRTFVYRVPPELTSPLRPGIRVEVPFRRRLLTGVVVGPAAHAPAGTLRTIQRVLDAEPALNEELLAFTRWLAHYYAAPWGEVLRAALPGVLTAPRRRRAVEAEVPSEGGAALAEALDDARDSPPELTSEQANALAHLERKLRAGTFRVVLVHGVTASGKTELYLRAAESTLALGGQVLVLVPEIGLSVQLLDRFNARLGGRVAVLHSGLTDTERRRQWDRVRSGEAPVVVGARSAVFAPLPKLRLIVVDEEHEGAYKQDEVPRYHARDAAVMRGRMQGAVVVLGSATPSLESAYNAARGRYDLVKLEHRVDEKRLPEVILADLRRPSPAGADEPVPSRAAAASSPATPTSTPPTNTLSPLLRDALGSVLARGEQAILLVHRRGHSNFIQCTECGMVPRCPSCEVALTYHAVGLLLRCHHCNRRQPAPDRCPKCAGMRFWYGGMGTQRVEVELKRELPTARILRMDFDSTRRRGAHREMIERFARREADILVGTQMVAKGLDFPEVSLVGVVSADTVLNLPDFRAGERFFQLLTQAAGRAGRGPLGGQVIIQTYIPDHPAIVAATGHDFDAFAVAALAEREEIGYPPFGVMARFHIDGPEEAPVVEVADRVHAAVVAGADVMVLGPAPLPLARLRGRVRWHLTLLGHRRERVHGQARRALRRVLRSKIPARVRLQLDIDPLHLL